MIHRISIASDHAGFYLKEKVIAFCNEKQIECVDFGTYSSESIDYPDIAHLLGRSIDTGEFDCGIILCGSGNGVNMVVNKYKHVRSALCWNKEIAELARKHNNANILALPARFIDDSVAIEIVTVFLNTTFEGGRHQVRVDKISDCQ
jgi:ribose 5-phosphate isomerase B